MTFLVYLFLFVQGLGKFVARCAMPLSPAHTDTDASSYGNSSTTTSLSSSSSTTVGPVFCGDCGIVVNSVLAARWWTKIYSTVAATIIYTTNKDTGATFNSTIQYPTNTTAYLPTFAFSSLYNLNGGTTIYTLNTLGGDQEYAFPRVFRTLSSHM